MITLHNVTEETKTIIKWVSVAIAAILVLLIIFRLGENLKERFFPTPLPPPTVSFEKLPQINFPKNITDKKLEFNINTISGKLPVFSDRTNVYKIVEIQPNLLSFKKAEERVKNIGFVSEGLPISETAYQWQSQSLGSLTLDVLSFNFNLSSNFLYDPQVLLIQNLPDENQAIEKAKSFLASISSLPNDVDLSKTKTTLFSINDSTLVNATSLSNAKIIRVDFFQKDINDFPIFYPDPFKSTMNFLIAFPTFEEKVVEANFFHQDISKISATYPIKTADEAFGELKNGKAYIASYFGENKEVSIKNVFLGYYMSNETQIFLMPIIIFEGDNGFFAYVSAVKNDWIKTSF